MLLKREKIKHSFNRIDMIDGVANQNYISANKNKRDMMEFDHNAIDSFISYYGVWIITNVSNPQYCMGKKGHGPSFCI